MDMKIPTVGLSLGVGMGLRSGAMVTAPPFVGPLDGLATNLWMALCPKYQLLAAYTGRTFRGKLTAGATEQDFTPVAGAVDDAEVVAFGAGASVSMAVCDDQSGNGRFVANAAQPTQQPEIYTGSAYKTVGSAGGWGGDFQSTLSSRLTSTLTDTLAQPCTVYLVAYLDTTSFNHGLFQSLTSGSCSITTIQPPVQISAGFVVTGPNHAATTPYIIAAVFDGAGSRVRLNDGTATAGNPGTNNLVTASTVRMGATRTGFMRGRVACQLIYSTNHDDTQEAAVRNALNALFGIF
jgi:hypothetical protein